MTPLMTSWITGTSNHLAFPVLKHGAAVRERRLEQELEPVALSATSAEPAKRLAPRCRPKRGALGYGQSCLVARAAPSTSAWSLAHCTSG